MTTSCVSFRTRSNGRREVRKMTRKKNTRTNALTVVVSLTADTPVKTFLKRYKNNVSKQTAQSNYTLTFRFKTYCKNYDISNLNASFKIPFPCTKVVSKEFCFSPILPRFRSIFPVAVVQISDNFRIRLGREVIRNVSRFISSSGKNTEPPRTGGQLLLLFFSVLSALGTVYLMTRPFFEKKIITIIVLPVITRCARTFSVGTTRGT